MVNKNKIYKLIKEYLSVAAAAFLVALAVHTFILPNKFVPGGASGIAAILDYIGVLPAAYGNFVVNFPLLVLGLIFLKKDFAVKTVFAIITITVSKLFLEAINFFQFDGDILLAVIMAGILFGLSIGIMFGINGSNGGTEVVLRLIQRFSPEANVSKWMIIVDACVIFVGGIIAKDIWVTLYSMLMTYTCSIAYELYANGIDPSVKFNVITDKSKELLEELPKRYKYSIHSIEVSGGSPNSKSGKQMITIALRRRQVPRLKELILEVDKECFGYVETVQSFVLPRSRM